MEKRQQFSIWYFIAVFLLIMAVQNDLYGRHTETLSYDNFKIMLKAGKLTDVAIGERTLRGGLINEGLEELLPKEKLNELRKSGDGPHRFVTVRVDDPDLIKELEAAKVRFAGVIESNWFRTLLSWVLPAVVFVGIWMLLMKRMGAAGGMLEIGKSKAKIYVEKDTRASFNDVAGVDKAKEELEEVVTFLKEPGRFDRQVLVDRPDKIGRMQILQVHLKKVMLAPGVDVEQIAALTPGFSGADLANLINDAALLATRRGAEGVALDDFTRAVERIVAGLEKKNRLLNPKEREVVAHHEMGHALVAMALPGTDPVHKISIIPRGIGALGYTIQRPTEDRFLMTREELENKMAVLLGGRAAEQIVFGHLSTGAADDLAKATDIARSMVMRYGMDEKLGHVALESIRPAFLDLPGAFPPVREYSEATAHEVDCAVRAIVQAAFERAVQLLTERRDTLDRGARQLLAQETLSGEDVQTLLQAPLPAAAAKPEGGFS